MTSHPSFNPGKGKKKASGEVELVLRLDGAPTEETVQITVAPDHAAARAASGGAASAAASGAAHKRRSVLRRLPVNPRI